MKNQNYEVSVNFTYSANCVPTKKTDDEIKKETLDLLSHILKTTKKPKWFKINRRYKNAK